MSKDSLEYDTKYAREFRLVVIRELGYSVVLQRGAKSNPNIEEQSVMG